MNEAKTWNFLGVIKHRLPGARASQIKQPRTLARHFSLLLPCDIVISPPCFASVASGLVHFRTLMCAQLSVCRLFAKHIHTCDLVARRVRPTLLSLFAFTCALICILPAREARSWVRMKCHSFLLSAHLFNFNSGISVKRHLHYSYIALMTPTEKCF